MQLKRLADDRIQETALPELDVRDVVQRQVEAGEVERALVHVGRDDLTRVAREQQRLDPVPGAEIERTVDRLADGQVGEHSRRSMDACDAVRVLDVEPIGRDQEVVVRDDAGEPVQQAVTLFGEPCLDQQRRELVRRRGVAEEEERDQEGEAVGHGSEPAPVDLQIDVREDRLAARVQAARDPGARVARRRELLPQSCCGLGRRRDGRRLQILTFFDRSQPACTGASRDPSAFCGL